MQEFATKLLEFIKSTLHKSDPTINLEQINFDTDLIDMGVESIIIISLISAIEEKFKINISLSNLEKNNFCISVKSICESINDERS